MSTFAIAIVGMAVRVPGARNISEFWRNLSKGVESVRQLSDSELLAAGVRPEEFAASDYVKTAAVFDDLEMFDAAFFGFSPKDASIMDPQHRHFLECAWESLEHAGHTPESFSGSIGVYAGSGLNSYLIYNLLSNRRLVESAGLFMLKQTGNDKDVLATRVSYQLNLRGPSINVQTACSTSLVAVHLACQSLLNRECDMALAGGVTIEIPHGRGYVYREGEILSRDGHCRPFDASSNGTVFSSGVGIVVLRRLADALEDGDTIHAVILGSAINNDGARKIGYLAPSVDGQAEVIAEALGVAGVSADTISYVETHGTGTSVGDPIEIKALTQAFRETTSAKGFCRIGSLKSNIGHLDAAAGVAGLIKTTLALKHRQIPASLHFRTPNPLIDFPGTPFCVNARLSDWKSGDVPRRAGVTSLGIGGTNAHVVLEEAPAPDRRGKAKTHQLIVLSAKTEKALEHATGNLASYLEDNPDLRFDDIAYTLQVGRKAFQHRRAVVVQDIVDAARVFTSRDSKRLVSGIAAPTNRMTFMFSGQGSQYVGMGRELYESEPVFRENIDLCSEKLLGELGLDIRTVVYAPAAESSAAAEKLNQTWLTQPALFSVEYSLAQWWMAHGLRPQILVGHSIGEYVAACISGVLSLEDALSISAERGRLMYTMPRGSMLAVSAAAGTLRLPEALSIAAINGIEQCVVAGPTEVVAKFEKALTEQRVACRMLQTSHAFHSSMMDPILKSFTARMSKVKLQPPQIPYLSNVTGTWITNAESTDPDYWAKHLRSTVMFSECLSMLFREPNPICLEIGPGEVLTSLARQHPKRKGKVFASMRHPQAKTGDVNFLLNTLGHLWISGQATDWKALHVGEDVRRVPLPTYPFERQRHWIDSGVDPFAPNSARSSVPLSDPLERWFHQRVWSRSSPPAPAPVKTASWLIFRDQLGLGAKISEQLRNAGHQVVEVNAADSYGLLSHDQYAIRPGLRSDYDELLAQLMKRPNPPKKFVYLWPVIDVNAPLVSVDEMLDYSFYGPMFLAQALGDQDQSGITVTFVSNRLQSVSGEPVLAPVRATLFGPAKVIPKELPGIGCRSIDLERDAVDIEQSAKQVIAEILSVSSDSFVAYRGAYRWIQKLERLQLTERTDRPTLKPKGVYFITGGLGGIALIVAEYLARSYQARLILFGRSELPPRAQWSAIAKTGDAREPLVQKLGKLLELEALGAEILVIQGDVSSREDVRHASETARKRFGPINGIIHAAGILEDAPLQIKSRESAALVLNPKVMGTLVLEEVFLGRPLDFFVLFSSISSLFPPPGQVDYAAANAFLDAFAASHAGKSIISINWGLWRDIGMGGRNKASHPLLERRIVETSNEAIYASRLAVGTHWILSEHRLKSGESLLPGTAYLEMAAAALNRGAFGPGVEFEDVFFLSPLACRSDETREIRVRLRRDRSKFRFSILSLGVEWMEHASGSIGRRGTEQPASQNLSSILARCRLREIAFDDRRRTKQEKYFDFGPRWRNLKWVRFGERQCVAALQLDPDFSGDLSHYHLHPGLLDLATGAALYLIQDYEQSDSMYLPLSYKKLVFYRPLPQKLYSYIRSRRENTIRREVVTFDVTLFDEQGQVLAEIEEFALRRIAASADVTASATRATVSSPDVDSVGTVERQSISPSEGVAAFARVLFSIAPHNLAVFPGDLGALTHATQAPMENEPTPADPRSEVETVLIQWWKELLGVDQVGLDDDFFDLGGHSLVGVRLFSKIKKNYRLDLGLSTLFETRTIRKLADLLRKTGTPLEAERVPWSALVPIQAHGSRPPIFLISGLGGNVVNFAGLARHLGEDQPVYALQPQGLDGRRAFHTRIEDMATYYLEEIRRLQPQGPYYLAGYSFGGFVAFEMAQQLHGQGAEVGLLGLLDTIEWHYLEKVKKTLRFRERLALYKGRFDEIFFGQRGLQYLKRKFVARSSQILYRILQALGRPLPRTVGTIEDINSFAAGNYTPRVFPGFLTIFRSIKRSSLDGSDELLGWAGLAACGVQVCDIPGTHHDMMREPNVRILAERLQQNMSRAQQFADSGRALVQAGGQAPDPSG